jgi:hypothetical protein
LLLHCRPSHYPTRLRAISLVAAVEVVSAIPKHMVAVARPISGKRSDKSSYYRLSKKLLQQQRLIRPPTLISRACEQAIKPEGISASENIVGSVVIESDSHMKVDLLGWT